MPPLGPAYPSLWSYRIIKYPGASTTTQTSLGLKYVMGKCGRDNDGDLQYR